MEIAGGEKVNNTGPGVPGGVFEITTFILNCFSVEGSLISITLAFFMRRTF